MNTEKLSMYAFFTDILRRESAAEAARFARECGFRAAEILEAVRGQRFCLPMQVLRNGQERRWTRTVCVARVIPSASISFRTC